MDNFLAFPMETIPYLIIALAFAFTIHEYAHAFVAYRFGDPTAKNHGRLTLSPLAHLDIFGTLMIFIAGFGWAKPVPVNRFYFKRPRLAGILVSVAGPLSNLILAIIGFVLWYFLSSTGLIYGLTPFVSDMLYNFLDIFIKINVILFIFNLLPFPPLDGYRIVEDLAPSKLRPTLTKYESFGIVLFLIIVLTPLDEYTINPIFEVVLPSILSFLDESISGIFN
jgi:Zn-dependent protease